MQRLVRVTSILTFFYRWILPPVIIIANLILVGYWLRCPSDAYPGLFIILVPYSICVSSLIIWMLTRLRTVHFNKNEVLIDEGSRMQESIPLGDVLKVTRYWPPLYAIRYRKDGKFRRALILPQYSEMIFTLGLFEPASVTQLREYCFGTDDQKRRSWLKAVFILITVIAIISLIYLLFFSETQ